MIFDLVKDSNLDKIAGTFAAQIGFNCQTNLFIHVVTKRDETARKK